MNYYLSELKKVRKYAYSNRGQLQTVIHLRNYINKNYNQRLDLESLAGIHCTSKFHLLRLFKRYYGQTPKQYLTYRRLEKARKLLRSGKSVSDTCFEVGFDSPSSFSTLFKRYAGCTPSDYAKEQFSQSRYE